MPITFDKISQILSNVHFWIAPVKIFRLIYNLTGFWEVRVTTPLWRHFLSHGCQICIFLELMYQSIPSLTIPHGRPPRSHCPGGSGFRSTLLAGGSGFRIREISYSFERKLREFLDLFQRNRKQLEKLVFLYCLISIFAKTVDVYCIFDNIYHFRPFWSFW